MGLRTLATFTGAGGGIGCTQWQPACSINHGVE
jgi:hypothetical protein